MFSSAVKAAKPSVMADPPVQDVLMAGDNSSRVMYTVGGEGGGVSPSPQACTCIISAPC